jgi:hypothetical protein
MSDEKRYLKWNEVDSSWLETFYLWSEVAIIIRAAEALGGGGFYDGPGTYEHDRKQHELALKLLKQKLSKEEYKQFVRIVCKINGVEMKETKIRKTKGHPEITVKEVSKAFDIINPKITVNQISRVDI